MLAQVTDTKFSEKIKRLHEYRVTSLIRNRHPA